MRDRKARKRRPAAKRSHTLAIVNVSPDFRGRLGLIPPRSTNAAIFATLSLFKLRLAGTTMRSWLMSALALYVRLEAKPSKEQEAAAFLAELRALALDELDTKAWFAIQSGAGTFAIFDVFQDERGREAHLNGRLAVALAAKAPELFSNRLEIVRLDILADTLPG
jgi:hypothetical protein